MKDYKFKTIDELNKGWFEVDGTKKRMKREEAIAFDEARVAEAEAKKIERLNKIANLIANKRNGIYGEHEKPFGEGVHFARTDEGALYGE